MKRLTDHGFWDQSWWKHSRPSRLWLYRDFDFETVRLIREAGVTTGARVLEVGAGGSRVLPYLARKFGYEVYGADFSLAGCRLLRANLVLQRQQGGVVCEDLFQSSLRPQVFDLVYSSGLVEHFDDLRAVAAAHLRLVRPGGRLVVIVPNLQGVQGSVMRRLAPPLFASHRIFGPRDLEACLLALGLEGLRSGYLGSFLIHVERGDQWTTVRRWSPFLQRVIPLSVRIINGVISFAFRLSPLRPHSRSFSHAFFAMGRKPQG